jgi:glucan phosphoethanolaminetransferase (alkaline phosphatase superfamily)
MRMNEWMNEWMCEWMNECVNKHCMIYVRWTHTPSLTMNLLLLLLLLLLLWLRFPPSRLLSLLVRMIPQSPWSQVLISLFNLVHQLQLRQSLLQALWQRLTQTIRLATALNQSRQWVRRQQQQQQQQQQQHLVLQPQQQLQLTNQACSILVWIWKFVNWEKRWKQQ